jgi:hypothetical protein
VCPAMLIAVRISFTSVQECYLRRFSLISKAVYTRPFQVFDWLPGPLLAALVTALALHLFSGVSRASSNFLLTSLVSVVVTSCTAYAKTLGIEDPKPSLTDVIGNHHWPVDVRTAIEQFRLSPDVIDFACCPTCSALYKPTISASQASYPIFCTNKRFKEGPECGTRLVHGSQGGKPIRTYAYQPLASWLTRFLSRPSIADIVTKPVIDFMKDAPELKTDIFHAEAARDLLGHDGKSFLDCPAGELRLVFNMNIDWFNPFGARKSNKQYSVGGVYLVCMNLPINMRYRVENVYLAGIIPGPSEPASDLSQLNYFLEPLVDNLLELYNPGIIFNNAASSAAFAYLVRCTLLALIADLPGFRKVAGFVGINHAYICAFCKLKKHERANFDAETWPRRTREEVISEAEAWRDARTQGDRDALVAKSGIRWSELLRLPYWNPLRHGVVDSMHNLFLGEAQRHCRHIWHMDRSVSPNKRCRPHSTEEQRRALLDALDAIRDGRTSELQGLQLTYLETIAHDNSVHVASKGKKATKAEYASALVNWVGRKFP